MRIGGRWTRECSTVTLARAGGEHDQRRLARKRSGRSQEAVEAGGSGVVGQLLAAGPVVAGQLSLFDAEGCPDVGGREVEDNEAVSLRPSNPAADLEGGDLVEPPVAEELGPGAPLGEGGVPGAGPARAVVAARVRRRVGDVEQSGPGARLAPHRPVQATGRQVPGRGRRIGQA